MPDRREQRTGSGGTGPWSAALAWLGRARTRLLVPWVVRSGIERLHERLDALERRVRLLQQASGRIETRQTAATDDPNLGANEFRVFSQWGEDGIIQHLVRKVPIARDTFVEIGVETYEEANTRFLMLNDNWSGVLFDGSEWCIERIRASRAYWLHDLRAIHAFVTRENVDEVLEAAGVTEEIGLLSIDIDGMDFWVWEALSVVSPAIVVIEYNHRFGSEASVTVPYAPDFERRAAHPSILYYGASLRALCRLGDRKGYAFVGAGSAGLNAFFVRRDCLPEGVPVRTPEDGFVGGRFSEAHDEQGRRVRMTPDEEKSLVESLPLVEIGPDGRPAGEVS